MKKENKFKLVNPFAGIEVTVFEGGSAKPTDKYIIGKKGVGIGKDTIEKPTTKKPTTKKPTTKKPTTKKPKAFTQFTFLNTTRREFEFLKTFKIPEDWQADFFEEKDYEDFFNNRERWDLPKGANLEIQHRLEGLILSCFSAAYFFNQLINCEYSDFIHGVKEIEKLLKKC